MTTTSIRPASGSLFRNPQDLRVSGLPPTRILIIGSCLALTFQHRFRDIGWESDYIIFNNLGNLPEVPPQPISAYDFQLIQISPRSLIPENAYFRLENTENAYRSLFNETEERMLQLLDGALKWNVEYGLLTFVFNFMVPQQNPLGRLMSRADFRNFTYFFRRLNDSLSAEIEKHKNAFVFDCDEVAASFGRRYLQDDVVASLNHGGTLGNDPTDKDRIHIPHRLDEHYIVQRDAIMAAMAEEIVALHRIVRQQDSVKVVIVDLDDTLWRGVVIDADRISGHNTEGWPLGLVEALLFLKRRGILLAIVSKNDEKNITRVWDRIWSGRLALDDFAIRKINWRSKEENIEAILNEMNLLSRSAVFIDDNPVERAAVSAAFPDIRVLGDEPSIIRRVLLWSAETQVPVITEESSRRTEMIQAQVERESVRSRMSRKDFLASLNVKTTLVEIDGPDDAKFARGFELLNKTNQFNTTGRRWTLEECKAAFVGGTVWVAFEVEDKFTNYGLVGVSVIAGAHIRQFVMSCRVIGLGVETFVMSRILEDMRTKGLLAAKADFVDTDANIPCRDFFVRCGFSQADGGWLRSLRAVEIGDGSSMLA
jgi:FkbH-like protein